MPRKFSTPYKLAAAIFEAMISDYTKRPKSWMQGASNRTDKKGNVSYCMVGGINHHLHHTFKQPNYHPEAYAILEKQCPDGIVLFNDDETTKRKDVIGRLKVSLEEANQLHKATLKARKLPTEDETGEYPGSKAPSPTAKRGRQKA